MASVAYDPKIGSSSLPEVIVANMVRSGQTRYENNQ